MNSLYFNNTHIWSKGMILIILLALMGCNNDELLSTDNGDSSTINVSFKSQNSDIQTRSTQSSFYENRVENLFLYVFDAKTGNKINSEFYEDYNLYSNDNGDRNQGVLPIKIPRNQDVQIYSVANIENDITRISLKELEDITNLNQLAKVKAELLQQVIVRGASFVMSGFVADEYGKALTINTRNRASRYDLKLRRLDAKIYFHIEAVDGAKFIPLHWQVNKIAQETRLQPVQNNSRKFFNSDKEPFENNNTGFSFYLLENLQTAKKQIPAYEGQGYQKRELQEKHFIGSTNKPGQSYVNGAFEYAPENGTYVVFSGELNYVNPETGIPAVADVTYTIHLGYIGNDHNDYSIKRNTEYHYYIRLKSAKTIEIEVMTGEEKQPGAKGHITTGSQIITLDAHYSTKLLTFNYEDIGHLTWYVKTPFSEGYREDLYNQKNSGDSRWVMFKVNTKVGDYYNGGYNFSNQFEAFPGSQNTHPNNAHITTLVNDNSKLITANQLIEYLHYAKRESMDFFNAYGYHSHVFFDNKDEIKVTAYINEYYYEEDPNTGRKSNTLWKKFVNAPDRILTFLNHSGFSPDGESSMVKSIVSFRQYAIQSFYNIESEDLQTAWGVERIQETDILPFSVDKYYKSSKYKSTSNGRRNTLDILENPKIRKGWHSIVDSRTNTLFEQYEAAKYACLLRNRDEDGDYNIDSSEVKWYLAAIDQLTDLWIGEGSMDEQAKLYHPENGQKDEWYLSSTVTDDYKKWDNPWVLWAKEGSSTGLMANLPNYNNSVQRYNYRCLRNLGMDDDKDAKHEAQDFAVVKGNLISLPYLNKQSIRKYSTTKELPLHHERDADNMPWKSFEVNKDVTKDKYMNWPDLKYRLDRNNSPCPRGYRVPNQRELAIMLSRLGNDKNWKLENHLSRTAYSMNPAGGTRYGFSVVKNGALLYLINTDNDRGGVRCVRDY